MHAHIRSAISMGAVEARRAVFIGNLDDNRVILNNLRQCDRGKSGSLPLPNVHGNTIPASERFSQKCRRFVARCRAFKPDDIMFLATPRDLWVTVGLRMLCRSLPSPFTSFQLVQQLWASSKVVNWGGIVTRCLVPATVCI